MSTIFQVDAKKLAEIRPRFNTETAQVNLQFSLFLKHQYYRLSFFFIFWQNTICGICNLNYDVTREIIRDGLAYGINATFDTNSCTKINQTGSHTGELDGLCNRIKEVYFCFSSYYLIQCVTHYFSDYSKILNMTLKRI